MPAANGAISSTNGEGSAVSQDGTSTNDNAIINGAQTNNSASQSVLVPGQNQSTAAPKPGLVVPESNGSINRKRRSESVTVDGGPQVDERTQEKAGGPNLSRKQRKKMRLANNS